MTIGPAQEVVHNMVHKRSNFGVCARRGKHKIGCSTFAGVRTASTLLGLILISRLVARKRPYYEYQRLKELVENGSFRVPNVPSLLGRRHSN